MLRSRLSRHLPSRYRAERALRMALVVVGFVAGIFSAAQAAPAMWRVSNATSQVYLFGTLHALTPGAPWRTPAYDAAYAQAKVVWFEADLGGADPGTVGLIVNRYGVDPAKGLSEKLAAADLVALRGQTNLDRIEHLRPWAAALMLSMQPALSRGAQVRAGADAAVTRQAHAGGKAVKAFETLEDQARLFASLPEPAEVQYLTDVIHARARPPHLSLDAGAGSLEKQWLDGDLARLGPGLVGEMAHDNRALYDVLLKTRNLAWADALATEMATAEGVELVNVGALHMVGADGLPALLQARGFRVERVQ